jgi:hypothetical protein
MEPPSLFNSQSTFFQGVIELELFKVACIVKGMLKIPKINTQECSLSSKLLVQTMKISTLEQISTGFKKKCYSERTGVPDCFERIVIVLRIGPS